MSLALQFHKLAVFSEGTTQDFPPENIHKSLKLLLRGTEEHSAEYVEKFFEPINFKYLQIDVSQLENFIPSFPKELKYPIFDPQKTTFFMMDRKIWSAIEQIVEARMKGYLEKKQKREDKLIKAAGISKDYELLSNLFSEKLLFANTF